MKNCMENVRKKKPLVHCITNYVTVNDVANVILAAGASPIMADALEEAAEIARLCGGVCINIGTLNRRTIEAMFAAGREAAELGRPVLIDPVGAGASRFRTETATRLIAEVRPTAVRGNMSELRALVSGDGNTQGVDASSVDAVSEDNLSEAVGFVKKAAAKFGAVVAVTGAIDLVADADTCLVIRNGRPEMGSITGTGCQLSGLAAAYLAANGERALEAVAAATMTMGLAGEIAFARLREGEGNATYRNRIIDAVYNMDEMIFERMAKYERA